MNGRRSRAFRAYQKVKTLKPARSLFDLSHDVIMSGDMGKLYPCMLMEMSPGDTFHMWNECVTRMMPLNAPILHDIKLYTHYFFVPYRILMEEWTEFISGGVDGENGSGVAPEDEESDIVAELPRWNPTNTAVGSLWDYCGFPTSVVPTGALPVDFVRRCYNRIWNEYYRDETLQDPVSEDNEDILYRNWRKDYFTSALTSQQRGTSPAMPLSGNLGLRFNGITQDLLTLEVVSYDDDDMPTFTVKFKFDSSIDARNVQIPSAVTLPTSVSYVDSSSQTHYLSRTLNYTVTKFSAVHTSSNNYVICLLRTGFSEQSPAGTSMVIGSSQSWTSSDFEHSFSVGSADLSQAGTFDVKDLRVAFQIQRWLELANRGGVRYTEFLRAFFGVSPRDDRLQRPEYIGGSCSPIVISEVLQTSATDSEPTPQGNMAGHGVGASRTYIGSYTAVEFGMVMGLLSVMPSAKYQQGINRQWLRRSKYDFLFPQFTGLSEQAIEEVEIFAQDTEAKNRKVFGYNEIYDELRSMPSRIVGKMRSTFDYWHLGRKFDSAPALNSDFIKCNPSKRIFAVPSEDGFIFNIANIVRAVRPLPKYGTPRGV